MEYYKLEELQPGMKVLIHFNERITNSFMYSYNNTIQTVRKLLPGSIGGASIKIHGCDLVFRIVRVFPIKYQNNEKA